MSEKEKPASVVKSKRKLSGTQSGDAETSTAEEAFSKVLQLVRQVQVGMQNIDPSHGLSGSQLWALWHISAHPGQRVSELAATLHIHLSTASNLLDKLEARSLIRRERRDADNRVVRLYLAEPGLDLVKSIPGPMQGHLRRALRDVPAPVLEGLIEGVGAVLDLMGEAPSLDVA
ncbi:MAG: MarR family transcriptional regulator [Sulfuritalea sp.]|nr:MarR family transcriptional regulator [Sulfuritalea sp.]